MLSSVADTRRPSALVLCRSSSCSARQASHRGAAPATVLRHPRRRGMDHLCPRTAICPKPVMQADPRGAALRGNRTKGELTLRRRIDSKAHGHKSHDGTTRGTPRCRLLPWLLRSSSPSRRSTSGLQCALVACKLALSITNPLCQAGPPFPCPGLPRADVCATGQRGPRSSR